MVSLGLYFPIPGSIGTFGETIGTYCKQQCSDSEAVCDNELAPNCK